MNIEMKDGSPKVSIIVTCFNLGKYLDSSVNSALNQTYKNIEVILVDDGSTEQDTKKIISKWKEDGRVKVIQISNGGVANARNVGIAQSKGQYICCLDADDKLDSQYIEKAVKVFKENKDKKDIAIVAPWVQRFGEDTGVWEIKDFNKLEMLWSNSIPISSVFKREVFDKVGGYDSNIDSHQDWELWISMVDNGYRWEVIEEKLFFYRVRKNSMITRGNKRRLDYMNYIIQKHKDLYFKHSSELILILEEQRISLEEFLKNEKGERLLLEEVLKNEKREKKLLEEFLKNNEIKAKKLRSRIRFLKAENKKYFNELQNQKIIIDINKSPRKDFFRKVLKNIYKVISFSYANIKSVLKRKLLGNRNVTALSLDVFDTLLRRKVHPEEIKFATSRYIYLKFNNRLDDVFYPQQIYDKRLEVERELFTKQGDYKLQDVIKILLRKLEIEQEYSEEIVNYEISLEEEVLYKDSGIDKFLGELLRKKRKYFVSDFYIPKQQLQPIINKYFPYLNRGYVSCDYNKTKSTGELFDEFLKTEDLNPCELLHVGDSTHSDVSMAKSKGLNALRYFNINEELKRRYWSDKRDERRYNFPYAKDIQKILEQGSENNQLEGYKKELYELGVKYSPIFYSFVLNILESAKEMDIDQVYYFTREGVFFRDIHERILSRRKYLEVSSEILEVSRVATFFVSLPEFTKEHLQRMWNQYKEQTPESFFKSLGIPIENVEIYLDKYGIEKERVLSLSTDENFDKLFQDTEFLAYMNNELEIRKDIFSKYLASKGLVNEDKRYMIVDIGWRGSIQDNLAYFLNKAEIIGKYLGLHSSYSDSPKNVFKSAYGPNYKDDTLKTLDIVNWTGVLEMLTNSPMGSTHTYEEVDGTVKPLFKEDKYETNVHNQFIKYFQMGVLDSIEILDNFMEIHAISSEELRPYVINLMSKLVYEPEYVLTEAYFNLNHNETFGLGKFTDMGELGKLNNRNILELLISRKYRKKFYNDAIKTCWRNGYWKYNRINGIMVLLTKVRYLLTGKL